MSGLGEAAWQRPPLILGAALGSLFFLLGGFEIALAKSLDVSGLVDELNQAKHAERTFAEIIRAMGGTPRGERNAPLGHSLENPGHIIHEVGGAIMGMVAVYALWRPHEVFDDADAEHMAGQSPIDGLKSLARHWPVYPALLIWFLWNFAPGSGTPLQYYLQDILHAKDSQWGQWNAIFSASFIPTFLVYGVLCRKFPLGPLLFWGTVIAIPQFVPLLFIHSVTGALIAAAPIGLMGGIATAAYLDLMIRACPRGLQGTLLMMSAALYAIVAGLGNLLGTNLYDHFGGFTVCVIAITTVYALILPVLLLVPKRLIDTADGQIPAVAFTTD